MIHYFTTWGENNLGRKLSYSPAGLNKAKYVVGKLSTIDFVRVASFASGGLSYNGVYLPKTDNSEKYAIRYCATFGSRFLLFRMIERYLNLLQMFIYILFSTKRDDILFFYNERYFIAPIKVAHKYLRRKVVIEVEDINTIAANYKQKYVQKEIDGQKHADAYVLVNSVLPEYLPFVTAKPHCFIYGAYNPLTPSNEKYSDGKIHILYSGTFNKTKGGAVAAIQMAPLLSDNYVLHITGFGSEKEVEEIQQSLDLLDKVSRARVEYRGFISLSELDILMQRCHVGLCTQDPTTQLNQTSFPSKILNYMSHGLVVLSGRNKVIEMSAVGDLVYYYDKQTPADMTMAVMSIRNYDGVRCMERIHELNQQVSKDLSSIINTISNKL